MRYDGSNQRHLNLNANNFKGGKEDFLPVYDIFCVAEVPQDLR
jgi:hypothetical protein